MFKEDEIKERALSRYRREYPRLCGFPQPRLRKTRIYQAFGMQHVELANKKHVLETYEVHSAQIKSGFMLRPAVGLSPMRKLKLLQALPGWDEFCAAHDKDEEAN